MGASTHFPHLMYRAPREEMDQMRMAFKISPHVVGVREVLLKNDPFPGSRWSTAVVWGSVVRLLRPVWSGYAESKFLTSNRLPRAIFTKSYRSYLSHIYS